MTSQPRSRMRPADRTATFVTAMLLLLVFWVIARSPKADEAIKKATATTTITATKSALRKTTNDAAIGDYCLEFTGAKSHVVIPRLRYDGTYPITLEAIATPYALDKNTGFGCIVGNIELCGLAIRYYPKRFLFHFNESRPGNAGFASINSNDEVQVDQSVHVAGVFDGRELRLYVNGKRQKNVETTTNPHYPSDMDFMVAAAPDKISRPIQFFKGRIDEVRISKVARYDEDFTPGEKPLERDDDTLVLYHFDEGDGTIAKDASGNGYDGEIHDAKWLKTEK